MLTKERDFITSLPSALEKAKKVVETLENSGLREFRQDWTFKSLSRLGELALIVAKTKVSSQEKRKFFIETMLTKIRSQNLDDPRLSRSADLLEVELVNFLKSPREDLSKINW